MLCLLLCATDNNIMQYRILFGIVALSACISPTSLAAIYKWVDENGEVVYSETRPPQQTEYERIRTTPPPSADPEAALQKLREQSTELEQRRETQRQDRQIQQQTTELEQQRAKNCAQLRKNLSVLEQNNRVREQQANGEYVFLTEDQRQAKIQGTRERIAAECQ